MEYYGKGEKFLTLLDINGFGLCWIISEESLISVIIQSANGI